MEKIANKNELTVLKKDNGYTTFKNQDEELVTKIKAVKLDDDSFSHYRHGDNCVIDKELDETQYLCKSEDGEFFVMDKSSYDEGRETELLNKINNLYPVHKYWRDNFGIIGSGYSRIGVTGNDDGNYDSIMKVCEVDNRVEISDFYGLEVTADINGGWGSVMFCHFNEDGNYVNRDYNIDIEIAMEQEPKTSDDFMEEVLAAIPDVEYQYAKDKWFTDDFALRLSWVGENENGKMGFELVRYDRLNEYSPAYKSKWGRRGSIKALKRTEPQTRQDILDRLKDVLDPICEHLGK